MNMQEDFIEQDFQDFIEEDFQEFARALLNYKTTMLEDEILDFWRGYEPTKVETLLTQRVLVKCVRQKAADIVAMQKSLEEWEQVPAALTKLEAWRRLMRIEEDEEEEAEAFGMTLEEYREYQNRW
jgi:hypothetical protein